ncbi:MAG: transposase, partial [Bacteroidota bacterium]
RTARQRLALRQRLSLPVYEALLDWVRYAQANNLSKGDMGKALHYAKNELPKLNACFCDGRLELDNNLIENSIRPLALGRKNYLFAGSHPAAKRAAMMYSFFASCQKLDVNPKEWLKDVLGRLPNHPINALEKLLPGEWAKDGEL